MSAPGVGRTAPSERTENLGWILGGLVVLGVFAVGAAFWFRYHP